MSERYGPARGFAFLLKAGDERLLAANVVKIQADHAAGDSTGSYVPIFTDPTRIGSWVADMARIGAPVEIAAAGDNAELVGLLADLREIGVTHVAFDPVLGRPDPDLTPITAAIIGFSVAG